MRVVRAARAVLAAAAIVAAGVVLVSGGSDADPTTPAALPGLPPPFLGTAVSGDGGLTAAIDAYGDVVNLYAPGPAGAAQIANSSARQAAATVPSDTGIVPRVRIGGGPALPLWRADAVRQRYLGGTNVVRTVASFGGARVIVTAAAHGGTLAVVIRGRGATPSLSGKVVKGLRCERERDRGTAALVCGAAPAATGTGVLGQADATILLATGSDRRWVARAQRLGPAAPTWAREMYRRSLLTLRALTATNGAAAAGAREGWAYVWPRDAATDALALEAAGYRAEAERVTRFLTDLPIDDAARFSEAGEAVPGRGPQGDEAGWVAAAVAATGRQPGSAGVGATRRPASGADSPPADAGAPHPGDGTSPADASAPPGWRERPDYQEGAPGDYLGNAIAAAGQSIDGPKIPPYTESPARRPGEVAAAGAVRAEFGTGRGLVRRDGDAGSGLDSAAGWAVRPFALRPLYPAARRTLLRLASRGTRFGITPGEGWTGGADPWSAPTAWSAWALAGLAAEEGMQGSSVAAARRGAFDRRAALALLSDLRRAATPAGALPERVDAQTGLPRSTTPLLWSHALTVLALRELWPQAAFRRPSG